MELSKGTKSTIWMGSICFAHFIGMLAFRAFIYAGMSKAPDDAYGISDIIELLLGGVFICLLAVSGLLSLALILKGSSQTKKSAVFLLLVGMVLFVSYAPLHRLAAGWGS